MAKCPKCNNQLSVFGNRETVQSSSGWAKYRVCPNCRAILKPKFNTKLKPFLFLIIFALLMLTKDSFHSSPIKGDLLFFASFAVIFPVLFRFFIEYDLVDNSAINKPVTEVPRPQFKDYLRSSGFLIIYAIVLAQTYFMHLDRYMSHKDKMLFIGVGVFLVVMMFLRVHFKQKYKN